jgi:hypothetical protein
MKSGNLFTAHPASVGESYWGHMHRAAWFGSRLMLAGSACFVHAIVPFLFVKTGSQIIAELHVAMVTGRSVSPASARGVQVPAK